MTRARWPPRDAAPRVQGMLEPARPPRHCGVLLCARPAGRPAMVRQPPWSRDRRVMTGVVEAARRPGITTIAEPLPG